jgi:hypothetical protein
MLHNFYYVNNVINSHIQTSVAQLAKASSCPYHVQHKLWKPSRSHPMPKLQMICANEFHHTYTTTYTIKACTGVTILHTHYFKYQ